MVRRMKHLNMENAIIENSNKLLNENGIIIITTPTKIAKPILEFLAYKLKLINEDEIREHKHYYNKRELFSWLENKGFKIEKYKLFQFGFNQIIIGRKVI